MKLVAFSNDKKMVYIFSNAHLIINTWDTRKIREGELILKDL